jgi:triphosphatase
MAPPPRPSDSHSASGIGSAAAEASDAREKEWQLAAPDLGVVQRWLDRHGTVARLLVQPLPPQQLHDTYLDTEDWRLFRAGFALRLREKDGSLEATLKGLRSARGDLADRREICEPLPPGGLKSLARAQGPVGTRVRDVAGRMPLRTLFQLRTSRLRYAVRSRKPAADLGEIALDEARFARANGHRRPVVLTRVELEAIGPDTQPLEELAQRLRSECELHPASENKFAVGLRSASLEPPRLSEADGKARPVQPQIEASTDAGTFALAALRRLADQWHAHAPAARLGESPEALHALRVTVRRMDTLLSLFGAYLPAPVLGGRPPIKGCLDALGAVRDVDIRIEAVDKFRTGLPQVQCGALDPLLSELRSERQAARSAMLRTLDGRARVWLDTLRGNPAAAARSGSRSTTALAAIPDLIHKRFRKLRKCARRLDAQSTLREYHKVRIRAKKLRYALEIVAPPYAKPAQAMLDALQRLQSRLGDQHDAGAMAQYLSDLAAHPPRTFTPATLFLMGRMAELNAGKAARLGERVGKPWRTVQHKRWRALHSRMLNLRRNAPRAIARASGGGRPGPQHGQGHGAHREATGSVSRARHDPHASGR